jgi:hypothetical protein
VPEQSLAYRARRVVTSPIDATLQEKRCAGRHMPDIRRASFILLCRGSELRRRSLPDHIRSFFLESIRRDATRARTKCRFSVSQKGLIRDAALRKSSADRHPESHFRRPDLKVQERQKSGCGTRKNSDLPDRNSGSFSGRKLATRLLPEAPEAVASPIASTLSATSELIARR